MHPAWKVYYTVIGKRGYHQGTRKSPQADSLGGFSIPFIQCHGIFLPSPIEPLADDGTRRLQQQMLPFLDGVTYRPPDDAGKCHALHIDRQRRTLHDGKEDAMKLHSELLIADLLPSVSSDELPPARNPIIRRVPALPPSPRVSRNQHDLPDRHNSSLPRSPHTGCRTCKSSSIQCGIDLRRRDIGNLSQPVTFSFFITRIAPFAQKKKACAES